MGSIDLWSLDVEGAELEVLRTVDFSRLQVSAWGTGSAHQLPVPSPSQGQAGPTLPAVGLGMACKAGQQGTLPCGMVCNPLGCSDRCMD